MKVLIFLSCLVVAQAGVVKDTCQGVSMEGIYYKKSLVLRNFDRPYLLDVNKETNDLYFSYSLDANSTDSLSVRLNLDRKRYYKIKEIENGLSHAVDQQTGNVYIGAYGSIYKYKPNNTPTEIVSDLDNWIADMFFKDDVLYYMTSPENKMYTFSKGHTTHMPELDGFGVEYFVLDENNAVFFSTQTGIYIKNSTKTVKIKTVTEQDVRGIALDNNGNVYASLIDGIYLFDRESVSMKKILDVFSSFGITFDRDNNMIYSTEDGLVKLTPIDESECKFIYK